MPVVMMCLSSIRFAQLKIHDLPGPEFHHAEIAARSTFVCLSPPAQRICSTAGGICYWACFGRCRVNGLRLPKDSSEKANQLASIEASLQRIEKDFRALRQDVPKETEDRLKQVEQILNEPKEWPKTAEATEQLRDELNGILHNLSPLTADRILPQLARANWGVEAVWNLHHKAKSDVNELETEQANLREMLDRQPQPHFKDLRKEFECASDSGHGDPSLASSLAVVGKCEATLNGQDDAAVVYSSLEEFRDQPAVAAMMPTLLAKSLERTGSERVNTLEKKLKQTASLRDDRFRHVSLSNIQEGLIQLIVDFELSEAAPR